MFLRRYWFNPKEIILAQKLITILDRTRKKGRDLYGVVFLMGKVDPDFRYIEETQDMDKDEFINNFIEQSDKFDYQSLAEEVEPFLVRSEQKKRVEKFKKYITPKLKNYLN